MGGQWVTITYDDWEAGLGNYLDGGSVVFDVIADFAAGFFFRDRSGGRENEGGTCLFQLGDDGFEIGGVLLD